MFNLVKTDIRHLLKSRSFYIILGVTAALILGLVALVSTLSDQRTLDALEAQGAEIEETDREMKDEFNSMTQLDFAHECLGSGFLLLLTGIGMTLFVHSDFSSGFVKNLCFARPRRWEYVLSKILAGGAYSGIVTLLGVLLTLVSPLLFGLRPAASPIGSILLHTFWMWLPAWAFGLMGLALVLLTRSSTLAIVLSVISGGGVTVAVLRTVCGQLGWPALEQYLLSYVSQYLCIPLPDAGRMAAILACSAGWAALYAAGSLLAMEKRDI